MRPRSRFLIACAALAAVSFADTSAHAQLGGMVRRAAGRAAGNAAANAVGAPTSSQARAPRFDEYTLEITAPVLERFLAGLDAEQAERARVARERAGAGDLRAQVERYERCRDREQEAQDERSAAVAQASGEVATRMAQAMIRGDTATYYHLADSLIAASGKAAPSACGERPSAAYETLRRLDDADEHVAGAAADAGGFTIRQFAVMRERIAPWVLSRGREGGFTADERRVLEARQADLSRHEEQLRS